MVAICSGGTSAPKVVPELAFTYGAGRLAQLLVAAGISEFSAALPLVGVIPILLSSFCASDPPAMTALSSAEANAVLNLDFGSDLSNGLGKLKDILLNLIWLDTCRCTSGTLVTPTVPGSPADVPVFVPPSLNPGPIVAQGWYPMLRADARVLALGCGSPARPANYQQLTFDDSAWVPAVAPTTLFALTWAAGGSTNYDITGSRGVNANLPGLVEYCAPADPLAHNCEQFLIRWKFFLGNVSPNQGVIRIANGTNVDGGLSSGALAINGRSAVILNTNSGAALLPSLLPNQWNIVAIDVNPSNTSSANTWGSHGGVGFGLDFTYAAVPQNVQPCCPPDVTTQAYLDLILQAVTLIQRQSVPFGYVPATTHAALSGAGSLTIGGLIGVKVDLTTIPASYGRSGTSPTEYFDLGWVTFGTPDGFPSSFRVDKELNLLTPRLCGAYTVLDYQLAPGVIATITELVREP